LTTRSEPVGASPPDLPEALERAEAGLAPDAVVEGALLDRPAAVDRRLEGLHLLECRLTDAELDGAVLSGAHLRDVEALDGSWANVRADRAVLRRVRFERVRLTGANLSAARIEDAVFVECRLDLVSLRSAELARARFEDCRLDEVDLLGASLESVVFVDCSLVRATWTSVTLRRTELRGCDLAGAIDPQRLRGARMPWPDVIRSAAELAAAAGIEVLED
jgi:uncharacterized protein YjbI with pentapeptide repeats